MKEITLSIAACCAVIAAPLIVPKIAARALYDDRPAMVIWDLKPLKTTLYQGESWSMEFNYTKRPECYPPDGQGEVEYRLWTWTPDGYTRFTVVANSVSFAKPSLVPAHRTTTMPLPILAPGRYGIETRAVFICHNASKPQYVNTVLIEFDVVVRAESKKRVLAPFPALAAQAWHLED